jgi:hypothetical protein
MCFKRGPYVACFLYKRKLGSDMHLTRSLQTSPSEWQQEARDPHASPRPDPQLGTLRRASLWLHDRTNGTVPRVNSCHTPEATVSKCNSCPRVNFECTHLITRRREVSRSLQRSRASNTDTDSSLQPSKLLQNNESRKNQMHTCRRVKMPTGLYRWINLNSVNRLLFVMVKCGVLFEVRTGFLNNI